MQVTVIGIGKMGLPMARHIATAGHAVVVYDNSAVARESARRWVASSGRSGFNG